MKASFVILNYNRKDELLITIAKTQALIAKEPGAYEIIAIDNNSSDGSAEAVKTAYPNIKLIERKENTGVAGWNYGFEKATGEYLIVLDDDSNLESGLEEALGYMHNNQDVGILALNVTTGPYTNEMFKWHNHENIIGFIGCGAIIRKSLFDKIGGFAAWLFIYGHEFDYAIRCLDAGYKVQFFENSNVIHRASAINRSSKRLKVFCTRNEMGIVYKHFSKERWKYLTRMLVNGLKCIKSEGIKAAYYTLLGAAQFLKMRKQLAYSPVSTEVQNFYADRFHSTKPIFYYLTKRAKAN
jgi:GT2 family glycosyltransferase